MGKGRLEAFSDGFVAIIITIMVLEFRVPHGDDLVALAAAWPVFFSYVLSFVHIAIYWNNHHHLLHAARNVRASVMWANMHLLFWLSLIPFSTGWMGENEFARVPVMVYGTNLLLAAIAYTILSRAIIAADGPDSPAAKAIGNDLKGYGSLGLYLAAIGLAFASPWISCAIFVAVAIIWLVPDRRIERVVSG